MSDDKRPADVLSLVASGKPDELAAALRKADEAWPREIQIAQFFARLAKTKYDAFVERGFTPAQAMQLTTKALWP